MAEENLRSFRLQRAVLQTQKSKLSQTNQLKRLPITERWRTAKCFREMPSNGKTKISITLKPWKIIGIKTEQEQNETL
jgi:hypothetical protein